MCIFATSFQEFEMMRKTHFLHYSVVVNLDNSQVYWE